VTSKINHFESSLLNAARAIDSAAMAVKLCIELNRARDNSPPTPAAPVISQKITKYAAREHMSVREAAEYLGVGRTTMYVLRQSGLPYVKIGKRTCYRRSDLDAWSKQRLFQQTPKGEAPYHEEG
jgi:excisionase family DNA binding protein